MNTPMDTLVPDDEYVASKIKEAPYWGHSKIVEYHLNNHSSNKFK